MKKILTIKFTLLAVFAGLFLTASAQAATFTVNSTLDNGTGGCTVAECTLREAIVAANGTAAADVIEFDAAVFNVARTITLSGTQLSIANNGTLTINGTGANLLTVSGNNLSLVFNIATNANATIAGLTVTGGNGGLGGGIYNESSGTVTLNNSTISSNTSPSSGGGIYNDSGTLRLTDSTVSNNSSQTAGGILYYAGTLTLTNTTVSGNLATLSGGNGGGGIIKDSSTTLTLNNSTVSNNTTTGFGGGIYNIDGTVRLNNSTVSGNSANFGGGGIRSFAVINLNNSIIANSPTGGDCFASTANVSFSLIENGSCGITNGVNGNKTGDPNLGPLQNNGGVTFTHALLTGSIAIDAGNSALTTDQRGSFRPVDNAGIPNATGGNGSDIGAFEVQTTTAAGISIGGRVLVSGGRGLSNALIYLTDQSGNTRVARSSTFGYYRFDDIEAGQTVIMTVVSKRYQFMPQVVNITEDLSEQNFVSEEGAVQMTLKQ